jgi:hypothetical protein
MPRPSEDLREAFADERKAAAREKVERRAKMLKKERRKKRREDIVSGIKSVGSSVASGAGATLDAVSGAASEIDSRDDTRADEIAFGGGGRQGDAFDPGLSGGVDFSENLPDSDDSDDGPFF